jgi:uncharacterized protein (TIGR02996 family)
MHTHLYQFLRAILESPADDTPRLVMADWLEDHCPAWSELIRSQIARYNHEPYRDSHCRCTTCIASYPRERELITQCTPFVLDICSLGFGGELLSSDLNFIRGFPLLHGSDPRPYRKSLPQRTRQTIQRQLRRLSPELAESLRTAIQEHAIL